MIFEAKLKAIRRKTISVGFWPTIKLILSYLIDRIFHRNNLLFYVDIPNYSVSPEKLNEGIAGREIKSIRDLSSEDIESISDYAGKIYINKLERRFTNNWRLFLAYIDRQVAGAGWVIDSNSEFKAKVVPLTEDVVTLIEFWTIPRFRGKNVYPFLLSFITNQLKGENFKKAFISSNEKNKSSINGIKKAGYRYLINYETYRLLSYEIVIWKHVVHN